MSASETSARFELLGSESDPALMTLALRRTLAFGNRAPEPERLVHVVGYIFSEEVPAVQLLPIHEAAVRLGVHLQPTSENTVRGLRALVIHTEDFAALGQIAQEASIPIINSLHVQNFLDKQRHTGIEINATNFWWVLLELALNLRPPSED